MSGPTREECEVCGHRHATLSMNGLCGHHIGAGVSATFCRCIHKNGDPADTLRARHVREAVGGLTRDNAILAVAAAANAYDAANLTGQSHSQADDAAHAAFCAALLAALTGEGM